MSTRSLQTLVGICSLFGICVATGDDASCSHGQFQSGRLVLTCNGGSDAVDIAFDEGDALPIDSFAPGLGGLKITSDVSADLGGELELQLMDTESSSCVVGRGAECTHQEINSDISYMGMSITFSGDDDKVPTRESIKILAVGQGEATLKVEHSLLATWFSNYVQGLLLAGCIEPEAPICDGTAAVTCSSANTTTSATATTTTTKSTSTVSTTSATTTTESTTTVSTTSATTTVTQTPQDDSGSCSDDQFKSGRVVLSCEGGRTTARVSFLKHTAIPIDSFALGIPGLNITLQPSSDLGGGLDLQLFDDETGSCIVGTDSEGVNCLFQEASESISYKGMQIFFSGDHEPPLQESIKVFGELTTKVSARLWALANGSASIIYSWDPLTPCPSLLPGCSVCSDYTGCEEPEVPFCNGTELRCVIPTSTQTTTKLAAMTVTSTTSVTVTTTWVPPCPADSFQSSRFALECEGGSGGGTMFFPKSVKHTEIFRLDPGLSNVRVEVTSQDVDADLLVIDRDSGDCLIGFHPRRQCMLEDACESFPSPCLDNDAALLSFNGRNDVPPINETVMIFEVRGNLSIFVRANRAGNVSINYSSDPLPSCGTGMGAICTPCEDYSGCEAGLWPICTGGPRVTCVENTTTSTSATTPTTTKASVTSSTATTPATTVTTTTTTTGPGCNHTTWLDPNMAVVIVSGSTCTEQMQDGDTCTITCSAGQVVGQFQCLMGQVVGRPICATEELDYVAQTKIAGSFRIFGELPYGATAESPQLRVMLQSVLASALGIRTQDFSKFLVTEPEVSVQYELKIDPERMAVEEMVQAMLKLDVVDPSSTGGLAEVFVRTALYYGYRITRIQTTHRPTDFQEMTIVSEAPPTTRALPTEYQLSSAMILNGFIFFTCGVSLVACICHSALQRWRRMIHRASSSHGKE